MRERKKAVTMEVPIIRIDVSCDTDDREVELLNNNNINIKNGDWQFPQTFEGRDLNSLDSRPIVIVDNRSREPRRKESNFKPLRKEETFPVKIPCRKNGLGLPTIHSRQSSEFRSRLSPSKSHQIFLDVPLSEACTDRLTPTRLTPTRTLRHLNVCNDDVSDSTSRLSPNFFTRLSPATVQDGGLVALNELDEVKETTARLKLPTRRPSYVAWHDKYVKRPFTAPIRHDTIPETEEVVTLTDDRRNKINQSLEWIKTELMEMRSQDKDIARQLLSLRKDINKLKLQKSCQEHEDLLDDAQDELEELHELSEMCDFPLAELGFGRTFGPLHHIGVTRLNISARRFSTC